MKTKKTDILTVVLFCGFLFAMLVLYLVLPKEDFSEKEKRYLAEVPKFSVENILSGGFGEQAETYLADHAPGRDLFVSLWANLERLSGKQVTKDVYLAENDRLVEAPVKWEEETARKNMNALNKFAEENGVQIDFMVVPSGGFVYEETIKGLKDPYRDTEILQKLHDLAGQKLQWFSMIPPLSDAEDKQALYYRTDHHWTSYGAYAAYKAYMEFVGRPYETEFAVDTHDNFQGSNYSRSGLWQIPGEPIELWKTDAPLTVTNGENETPHDGVFYEERLEELDKYTVFLDGNHSLVRIDNPEKAGSGKLLVIRDSYANCLGTFLANSYESVVLVDLRYYKKPVSELLAAEDFTDVLVCYSIGNFLTDTNLIWLR